MSIQQPKSERSQVHNPGFHVEQQTEDLGLSRCRTVSSFIMVIGLGQSRTNSFYTPMKLTHLVSLLYFFFFFRS